LGRFYATLGARLGLWDRKSHSLRESAFSHPTFGPNLQALRELFRRGWTAAEIEGRISQLAKAGVKAVWLRSVVAGQPPSKAAAAYNPEDELLEVGKRYYHKALKRITPPVYKMDSSGRLECVSEPSIAPRESFRAADLVAYYKERLPGYFDESASKLGSAFSWMLSHGIELDELLFAVDKAAADGAGKRLVSPFDLIKLGYLIEARESLLELKRVDG